MSGAPPRYDLPRDQPVRLNGKVMTYRGRAVDRERRHRFEGVDGIWRDLSDHELRQMQVDEALAFLTPSEADAEAKRQAADGRSKVPVGALVVDNPEEQVLFERKLAHCLAWKRAGRPSRTAANMDAVIEAAAETAHERKDYHRSPSARTVLGWVSEYVAAGEDSAILVPKLRQRGCRQDRLHPSARELLEKTVEEHYLKDTRPTGVSVHQLVQEAFRLNNEPLPPSERLDTPSLNAVYAVIHRIDRYTLDFSRYGKRFADRKWAPVGSGPVANRHNECWEIDHTRVDMVVVDDDSGEPIGRPWLTVIVDRATRMVPGMFIGFQGPRIDSVFVCLEMAIASKDKLIKYHNLAAPWPCEGVPTTLVTDQGTEFKSRAFVDACGRLGIDIQYTPILKPWFKGRIERFIQTLTRKVFHTVPGTTFADVFERNREQVPEKVAIATLGELRDRTIRYLAEIYHRTRHRALMGKSPLEAWDASVVQYGQRLPPDPKRVREALARVYWRVPQREGLQVHHLLYEAPELAEIRRIPREGARTVLVKLHRSDLTRVFFVDPRDNETKEARIKPHLFPRVQGVTLERWLLALALQRENPEAYGGDSGVFRAYAALDAALQHQAASNGARNREEAAKRWAQLMHKKHWEDASAFEPTGTSKSVSDLLEEEEDGAVDVAPSGHEGIEASTAHADDTSVPKDEAQGTSAARSRPKRRSPRRPREVDVEPPAQKEEVGEDDFDPESYAREHGLGTDKRRNTGDTDQ